jgi:hypothetical protein
VQDSAIVKLPTWLFPRFSGVSNQTSSVCNARIQAVFDLMSARLLEFSIDRYILMPRPENRLTCEDGGSAAPAGAVVYYNVRPVADATG